MAENVIEGVIVEYAPEASALTRRRIRIEEKAERSKARRDRVEEWLDGNVGQMCLVGTLLVVVGAGARLVEIVGN